MLVYQAVPGAHPGTTFGKFCAPDPRRRVMTYLHTQRGKSLIIWSSPTWQNQGKASPVMLFKEMPINRSQKSGIFHNHILEPLCIWILFEGLNVSPAPIWEETPGYDTYQKPILLNTPSWGCLCTGQWPLDHSYSRTPTIKKWAVTTSTKLP